MLGLIRYQQGQMPEALSLLEQALQLQLDSPDALSNYGLVLRAMNRREKALAALDRAIELRPSYPENAQQARQSPSRS
jgi:tetratricopeptide (TPR) repeat protein